MVCGRTKTSPFHHRQQSAECVHQSDATNAHELERAPRSFFSWHPIDEACTPIRETPLFSSTASLAGNGRSTVRTQFSHLLSCLITDDSRALNSPARPVASTARALRDPHEPGPRARAGPARRPPVHRVRARACCGPGNLLLYCIRTLRPRARHGTARLASDPSNMCGHVGGGAVAARASRVETKRPQPRRPSRARRRRRACRVRVRIGVGLPLSLASAPVHLPPAGTERARARARKRDRSRGSVP